MFKIVSTGNSILVLLEKITQALADIPRIFFEQNAEIGQKDHVWMGTELIKKDRGPSRSF